VIAAHARAIALGHQRQSCRNGEGNLMVTRLRAFKTNENVKITVGAICAVVTVGLLAAIALAFLWVPPPP
jgi:hypothetical protein